MDKNVASQKIGFVMVDKTNFATPETGIGVSGIIRLDGGASTSISNVVSELSEGFYVLTLDQAETNGDLLQVRLHDGGTSCANQFLVFYPETVEAIISDILSTIDGPLLTDTGTTLDDKLDSILVDTKTTLQNQIASILVDTKTTIPATITTIDNEIASILVDTKTTLQNQVASILVDTKTTIPATITTIDNEVGSILIDTKTTLDDKIDSILADTKTTIPATITTLDNRQQSILTDTKTTLDDKIDSILADTKTTLDDKLDSILADTGTTLEARQTSILNKATSILTDTKFINDVGGTDDGDSPTANSVNDMLRTLRWIIKNRIKTWDASNASGVAGLFKIYKDDSTTVGLSGTITDDSSYTLRVEAE